MENSFWCSSRVFIAKAADADFKQLLNWNSTAGLRVVT
jgi:hypothetical protein